MTMSRTVPVIGRADVSRRGSSSKGSRVRAYFVHKRASGPKIPKSRKKSSTGTDGLIPRYILSRISSGATLAQKVYLIHGLQVEDFRDLWRVRVIIRNASQILFSNITALPFKEKWIIWLIHEITIFQHTIAYSHHNDCIIGWLITKQSSIL